MDRQERLYSLKLSCGREISEHRHNNYENAPALTYLSLSVTNSNQTLERNLILFLDLVTLDLDLVKFDLGLVTLTFDPIFLSYAEN